MKDVEAEKSEVGSSNKKWEDKEMEEKEKDEPRTEKEEELLRKFNEHAGLIKKNE